ncbi:MAG: 4Fe-4S binding protein [Clostridia bacterium]|nr:4Fe-4S binding protein [Clostridia bacterium]
MKKLRFILEFPPECSDKPLTYHLVKDYDIKINILRGTISAGKEGKLLVEFEALEENLEGGRKFLESEGIRLVPIDRQVVLEKEKCIHCGACTAVCFTGALILSQTDWQLLFEPDKCVACQLCVEACPLNLITVSF